jgi:hypothetical protein
MPDKQDPSPTPKEAASFGKTSKEPRRPQWTPIYELHEERRKQGPQVEYKGDLKRSKFGRSATSGHQAEFAGFVLSLQIGYARAALSSTARRAAPSADEYRVTPYPGSLIVRKGALRGDKDGTGRR